MPDIHSIAAVASKAGSKGLPPVHLWNPPFCGDIDMRIKSDGAWFYQGTPIGRPQMVKLFSSILRKDADRYVLVTPVEMVGIEVEDVPFLAVEMRSQTTEAGRVLRFRTNVEDWVTASAACPMRFEPEAGGGLKPYVLVRGGLWARLTRSVYHELVALAEPRDIDGISMLGVVSEGAFFAMAAMSTLGSDIEA
ncbi:MAG: DUF1285 domain-containing protein [Beijerinckiaceae bacterium]